MKMKSTKRALLMSALSLLLCVSMLVGSTFAWFTDSVTSGKNTILSGNLDIELEHAILNEDGSVKEWKTVKSATDLFSDTLWEPGHTQVAYLKLSNLGTLALKYDLGINIVSETEGTRVNAATGADESFKLSDYIYMGVVEDAKPTYTSREAAIEAAKGGANGIIGYGYSKSGSMLGKTTSEAVEQYLAVVVYMPETIGNEANYKTGTAVPTINLGIELFATQLEAESDSFGKDYDKDAIAVDVLATPETIDDILAEVEAGTVIGLKEGYYEEIVLTQDNLTLTSAGGEAIVGFLNLNAKDNAKITNLTFDENGAQETYTFKTGNKQTATGVVANITGDTNSPKAADGVVISDCTFTNASGIALMAADNYVPIYFHEQGAATERCDSITVENCVFACNATQYICLNYLAEGSAVIKDNVFGSAIYGTSHNTINATGNSASWTVTGNTFYNWNTEKAAIGSSRNGAHTITWNVSENAFNHKNDAVVLSFKTSYTTANTVLTVANNTSLNGAAALVATATDAEGAAIFGGYKIQTEEGVEVVGTGVELDDTLNAGGEALLLDDVTVSTYETDANSGYGKTGVAVTDGAVLDGNGNTLTVNNANGSWDCAVQAKNGTIQNLTVDGAFRGIFMGSATGDVYIDNVIIDNVCYTFNSDGGSKDYGVYISNSTLNGWTSFSDVHKEVIFTNCNFGAGTGSYKYAFCRPYNAPTVFKNCVFQVGYEFDTSKTSAITFENCYYGDTLITPANALSLGNGETTFFYNGLNGITIGEQKVDDASNDTELAAAIESGSSTIVLGSGTYTIPDAAQGETLTIVGNGDTVVAAQVDGAGEGDGDYSFDGATVTFENVTITTKGNNFPGYPRMKGTFKNCTINGVYTLYESSSFTDCTFNVSGDMYNIWTWGAAEANFDGCTFNCDGKAVLLYGTANTKLTMNNCTFNDNGDDTITDKAAIEIGNDYGKTYELTVNNATVKGFAVNPKGINTGTTLWANKNSMGTDKLNVVVDGIDVY